MTFSLRSSDADDVFTLNLDILFGDKSVCTKNSKPFNWLQNEVEEVEAEIHSHKALFKFKDASGIPLKQFFEVMIGKLTKFANFF